MRVAVVGFMGSGKSQAGKVLASSLGYPFRDLDEVISTREGLSIPDIFSRYGEVGFRAAETSCLRLQAEEGGDMVLACGGGVVLSEENRRLLRARFLTIWIDVPAEALVKRLLQNPGQRPLLPSGEKEMRDRIISLLEERRALYGEAARLRYRWKAEDGTPEATAGKLLELLRTQDKGLAQDLA